MAHPADPTPASVAVCIGKDCRRRAEFADLRDELMGIPHVETRCLDVCKGPVVVVCPESGDEIVLAMVRSGKQQRDLRRTVVTGQALSERLERHLVTGSKRRTALRRLHRSVRRHR
jgi:(2Fe-2S) ferredoxin